jgi:thiol-disulfide isomerase/thioredoxin
MKKVLSLIICFLGALLFFCFSCTNFDNPSTGIENSFQKEVKLAIYELQKNGHKTNYYYFNIWALSCIPCIKEMPRLDSLAKHTDKDITWVYTTPELTDDVFQFFRKKKELYSRTFFYLNERQKFINVVCKELQQPLAYPIHLITDSTGKIIHSHSGYIDSPFGDVLLNQAIKRLP